MSAEEWLRARGIEPVARRGPPAGSGDIAREPTQAIPAIEPLSAPVPPPYEVEPETGIDVTAMPTTVLAIDDPEIEAALEIHLRDVAQDGDVEQLTTVVLPTVPTDVTRLPTRRLAD